jgi:type IV pilus assembly protein PilY1
MGDPLHSQPAAIVYGGTVASPEVVVFTATNDGYVHAIDGSTGEELWSFIPREHLENLPRLFFNSEAPYKFYGVDGDIVPVVKDVDDDGTIEPGDGDFVYIIFGMRRGGSSYYALDVTDKNAPQIKWRISTPDFGQTWSRPTVARVNMNDLGLNSDKAVVIFGGGYDTAHDTMTHPSTPDTKGAGIYFVDLQSGNVLWRAGRDAGANLQLADLTRSIPTQIRVIDLTGDGYADRMYASDMGGQVLRFDIFSGKSPNGTGTDALVTGGVVAQLGAEGLGSPAVEDTRRFYAAPDVSIFNDNVQNRRFIAISLGSGYRAHPLDDSNTDRFYSIRDRNVFNTLTQAEYDAFTPYTESDLVEVSGTVGTAIGPGNAGWKFTLPAEQKVFSNSVTFNNEVFFVAFSADTAGAAVCSAGLGRNFLYRVSVINGDPITDIDAIVSGEEDNERVEELAQGGIAPSPAFLFPSPDPGCTGEECSPPPIGCIGVECFDPGFDNFPVRTLWTQDGIE